HMQFQVTYDDPKMLTKPITVAVAVNYAPDTDMIETICDNEKDQNHLVGHANPRVELSAAILDRYAGTYEFRQGPPVLAGFFGVTETVTVKDRQLWMNAIPLIPQSETSFESSAAPIEFFLDSNGGVTHMMLRANEGEARYERKH